VKEQLERRLRELKAEFESGQKALADLEARQANLENTLRRISGAIQELERELAKEGRPGNGQPIGRRGGKGKGSV
jgi:predicted nuclease with TOPRIM domain